jgi:hypothetical protein
MAPRWFTERCTCRLETVSSASIDPPEMILDPWCPVHGTRDPDFELEQQRDDAMFFGETA